jgi:hypothetical protein
MQKYIHFYVCLFIVLILSGCSWVQTIGKTDDEIVALRAEQRWKALIEGDIERAYGYLSPGYRQITSYDRYRRRIHGVGVWKEVKIESTECKPERCKVGAMVSATFMHPRMKHPFDTQELMQESWVYDSSSRNWYLVPKQ